MDHVTTAGAAADAAPAELRLRAATFGDWVEIGDMQRATVVNPRGTGGDAAVELKVNPYVVARYLETLSGLPTSDIRKIPMPQFKGALRRLYELVPAFDEAKPDARAVLTDKGFEIALTKPLPGAREQRNSLFLRAPDVGDWIDCGDLHVQRALNPGADNQPAGLEVKLDEAAVERWMAKLTGLPTPILYLMDYHDARRVFATLKPMLSGLDAGN